MQDKILAAITAYTIRIAESEDTEYPQAHAEVMAAELRKFFASAEWSSVNHS
jgi:hypothetical protein